MSSNNLSIVLLAGGVGSRMKSTLPKSLHLVKNIPMISRIFNSCLSLRPREIVILCSPKTYELTKQVIDNDFRMSEIYTNIIYKIQLSPEGTGHAVMYAIQGMNPYRNVLILSGDSPFITFKTLLKMTKTTTPKLLISEKTNPFGYGRIILNGSDVVDIVEEKDCNDKQRLNKLVNGGSYFVNKDILKYLLSFLKNNNKQGEYYLTDITSLFGLKMNRYFKGVQCDIRELQNVNTKEQLDLVNKMCKL